MISLASWWEFHIFKTERILSMPERWAEMLPALGRNAVLHKIVKCKHDISTAAVELAKGELVWAGNYHLGQKKGVAWTFLVGGGILVTGA